MMFFKGTPSEKKNSQDDLPALAYFSKIFTLHVFLNNLPSKKGRSNVTNPVRVRVKLDTPHILLEPLKRFFCNLKSKFPLT